MIRAGDTGAIVAEMVTERLTVATAFRDRTCPPCSGRPPGGWVLRGAPFLAVRPEARGQGPEAVLWGGQEAKPKPLTVT